MCEKGLLQYAIRYLSEINTCPGINFVYVTCGREVYEINSSDPKHLKAEVERPYNCMVGCSTCAVVCPTQAIQFPSREVIWKIEREHKIFQQIIHKEAQEKRAKSNTIALRHTAEEQFNQVITRIKVRIAGVFGEKQFLKKLQNLIKDRDFDLVNLQLNIPTLKGLTEQTPGYMDFEVTSTTQSDVMAFVSELRALTTANDLLWVSNES